MQPNPFPTPADIHRASAGPLADLAKKLAEALANGNRQIGVPAGLAALTAASMREAGWVVTEQANKEHPINLVDLVFSVAPTPHSST